MRTTRSSSLGGAAVWAVGFAILAAATVRAGGSAENVLLIIDPSSVESLYIGKYYKNARNIPDRNVLYVDADAANYPDFAANHLDALFGTLANADIGDHIDYIVIAPGPSFYMDAPGLISDGCFRVARFSMSSAFTMAFIPGDVLGGMSSQTTHGYFRNSDAPMAFDSSVTWLGGSPSTHSLAKRYFIGAMLGYTGPRGNTVDDLMTMIDRSVGVDGTRPAGTFYFMETTDPARSGPRHNRYPLAANSIIALGGQAEHLFAVLPIDRHDCLGIMTGAASPGIEGANMTILPGAFCDHLTSFAAKFDTSSQEKLSRWIFRGASGSWGAVEEPCNYPGKFPQARMHVFYFQGLSLGESALRSAQYVPFQLLLYGDPMTRPFAHLPAVQVPDAPAGPVSGMITLTPEALTTHPTALIESFDLLIDGVLHSSTLPGSTFEVNTAQLADGSHDLRVLAFDDSDVRSTGRWTGALTVDNSGRSASLGVVPSSGDWSTPFVFDVGGSGGNVVEVRVVQNGRVLAAATSASASLTVHGLMIGSGPARVQTEALFDDGRMVRSAPLMLDIDFDAGIFTPGAPVAFSYTKHVLPNEPFMAELPATIGDSRVALSYSILTPPTQATVATFGGTSAYRLLRPNAGASGTDQLTFQVDSSAGQSNVATVTIIYSALCPADLNGDGVVDLADLGILLADFGCVAPGPCPGDIDGDGDTDLADLGILLSQFGTACS